MTMDFDSPPEPGVVEIRGPRLAREVALGYILPLGTAFAVLAGIVIAIVVSVTAGSGRGVSLGIVVFVFLLLVVWVFALRGSRRRIVGRDVGAGLALAELGPTGARLRYEYPSPRDRRRGQYRTRRYDAAVAWADVTGWRRGIDPFGAPVLILEVADPDRVAVRPGSELTQFIRLYVGEMRGAVGSAAVIRIPSEQAEGAAVSFLKARQLAESASIPPPRTWPVDGDWLVRRGVAEMTGGRAWPARSLSEVLGFGRSGPDRR